MSQEERQIINKIYKNACCIKYSIISLIISCITMFGIVIADFIGYRSNYAGRVNNIAIKCFIAFMVLDVILIIIYAINFWKFKKIVTKNETWNNLIDKLSKNNSDLNKTVENLKVDFQSELSIYLSGDLLTTFTELKDLGNTIKAGASAYVFYLLIDMSNKVIKFSEMISKEYRLNLKFSKKFFLCLVIIICLTINIVDYSIIIKKSKSNNKLYTNIVESLNSDCSKYNCSADTYSFKDRIKIHRDNNTLEIGFDKEYKVTSLNYYISKIDSNLSNQDKINMINIELKELSTLLKNNNTLKFDSKELLDHYQLTDKFISEISKINDEDDYVRDNFKINGYKIDIYGKYDSYDNTIYTIYEIDKEREYR